MRALALCLALLAGPAAAQQEEVDVELLLLVDVSRSMSASELDLQRRGYAEALTSEPVVRAIVGGMTGRIAVAYVEWAGAGLQRIVVDWTLVEGPDELEAIADALRAGRAYTQSRTSISGALRFGSAYLDGNGFAGLRRVIDISGDGPNNQGAPVTEARDAAVADGIVVNGLPLMTREPEGAAWRIDDLDVYYAECVIGGPGAFVLAVTDWPDFAAAVGRKLVLELAGRTPEAAVVPAQGAAPYDCLIGERLWQQNRWWGAP
ncbi:DUF1194 domain-containing protein [Wenxinia marina]|uniref:VWFA domain-containing protein n=1 Tax=Wenxinia marina DSM 24838 TaxID=1123501 RepID=A0A0D0NJW4_9RHOB|nr:DUF1194 domain-containing protein [Wenxinia marina]KIQ68615.1 hypothetical protein Wenmar_02886 [Wenxinia marina DSM 24838]GGL67305.1 hypothetical protein GCM10011392_22290 [Wenxinia marina]